ncbi:hypothetical protein RCH12_003410 [Cryobacterium sp. MP_3.1]|uniref:hypothetical protein n=1 Tax=Cryobacterium sp. MP_3.1 TaxID=3071711 RepID=UPI002E0908A0|nr:hypothetical protein [Cryobacterium sp. MP_3.1]
MSNIVTPAVGRGVEPFSITISHVEEDGAAHAVLVFLEQECNLVGWIVQEVLALLPNREIWRLTLTGDVAATVNEIQGRSMASAYTTDRGTGHVGGVTLPRADGTFDIVIGIEHLVNPIGDSLEFARLADNAIATGRHLGRHEAGHVLLSLRGESAENYRDLPSLDPIAAGLAPAVAAFMEDFRIERHVREHAPPVFSHLDGLQGSLEHLSSELMAAKASWSSNFEEAIDRSDKVIGDFVRVISYLSAELGLDIDGQPVVPNTAPLHWDRYLGNEWLEWSAAFHRLRPVDEVMALNELSEVLGELCELVVDWAAEIGYARGHAEDGREYAYWTEDKY